MEAERASLARQQRCERDAAAMRVRAEESERELHAAVLATEAAVVESTELRHRLEEARAEAGEHEARASTLLEARGAELAASDAARRREASEWSERCRGERRRAVDAERAARDAATSRVETMHDLAGAETREAAARAEANDVTRILEENEEGLARQIADVARREDDLERQRGEARSHFAKIHSSAARGRQRPSLPPTRSRRAVRSHAARRRRGRWRSGPRWTAKTPRLRSQTSRPSPSGKSCTMPPLRPRRRWWQWRRRWPRAGRRWAGRRTRRRRRRAAMAAAVV